MKVVFGSVLVGLVLLVGLQVISSPGPQAVEAGDRDRSDDGQDNDRNGNAVQERGNDDAKASDDDKPESSLAAFMHTKLDASNRILEGLVTDEMKKVQSGADQLLQMSDAAQWRASNDMLYLQHSRTFRQSVLTLRDKAGQGSVDGVALAWMDVTLNCIRCHEWVRNVLVAEGASVPNGLRTESDIR